MSKIRNRVTRDMWRERGFDLADSDISVIDSFFAEWFEIYNREGLTLYRSQESLFASQACVESFVELGNSGRRNRGWISSIRMGYAVAVLERERGDRAHGDKNIRALFEAKSVREEWPPTPGLDRALRAGNAMGALAIEILQERPEMLAEAAGFKFREAVFVDIKSSLMWKHVIGSRAFNRDIADALVRAGHAVGWLEESMPFTIRPEHFDESR